MSCIERPATRVKDRSRARHRDGTAPANRAWNAIEGRAFSALGAYGLSSASDLAFNTYVGNQIATFDPIVADVFFDYAPHDSVFNGFSGRWSISPRTIM